MRQYPKYLERNADNLLDATVARWQELRRLAGGANGGDVIGEQGPVVQAE